VEKITSNPSSPIAMFIKAVRKALNLTQEDFGDLYNCTKGNVSGWENGRYEPPYSTLSDMSERTGIALPNSDEPAADVVISGQTPSNGNRLKDKSGLFQIDQYETGGKMGNGLVLRDQPGVIARWEVSSEWIQKNVPHCTNPKNLCIVTGFGDSMLGMYNPGDPLLVDKGITTCEYDGVYFFRVGQEGFVKRLQRIPEQGILVLSENNKYRDWTINPEMDFEVFGKVLRAWRGENY
jgi:transcriptional regulator with XRE-family HTH domain